MPTGLSVTHPLTGEPIDVWVGNYVLMGYGDGAVMGVPAHDERDFAFAQKYGLPIMQVMHVDGETLRLRRTGSDWYGDKQRGVTINSDMLQRLRATRRRSTPSPHALRAEGPGREEDHLAPARLGHQPPALLGHADPDHPLRRARRGAGAGEGPAGGAAAGLRARRLRQPAEQARRISSPAWPARCAASRRGARPTRWTPSSTRPGTSCATATRRTTRPWSARGTDYWMPMDQYIGGIEHAILHLLYARFWTKVMRDLGLVKVDEPFTKLLTQGMVLNHIFSRTRRQGRQASTSGRTTSTSCATSTRKVIVAPRRKADGQPVDLRGLGTMSKSKNNGVDPQDLIEKYGADTARLFTMFTAPPEATLEWNDAALEGSLPLPAPGLELRRTSCMLRARQRAGAARPTPASARQPRRCAARSTPCSSRSTTTTSACSTTPWSRAR